MPVGDNPYANCTQVTPQCPVDATTYTYRPNLGANVFFLSVFAACALVQAVLGIKFRTWTFMIGLVLGCVCEAVGYIGRVMLNHNPWSRTGFEIQIICLIIAPAFIAAGIYLTLKHFVLAFGQQFSPIKASLYTWIFICADVFSLLLQGAGGGIAASSSTASRAQTGTNVSLAGIVFQVVSLAVFGLLFTFFFVRVHRGRDQLSSETRAYARSPPFRLFFAAVVLAYLTVLTRCIYRIPELSGGWRNPVMLNQLDFIVLDGVMMTIATLALTLVHPGWCFGGLSKRKARRGAAPMSEIAAKTIASLSDNSDVEDGNGRRL